MSIVAHTNIFLNKIETKKIKPSYRFLIKSVLHEESSTEDKEIEPIFLYPVHGISAGIGTLRKNSCHQGKQWRTNKAVKNCRANVIRQEALRSESSTG